MWCRELSTRTDWRGPQLLSPPTSLGILPLTWFVISVTDARRSPCRFWDVFSWIVVIVFPVLCLADLSLPEIQSSSVSPSGLAVCPETLLRVLWSVEQWRYPMYHVPPPPPQFTAPAAIIVSAVLLLFCLILLFKIKDTFLSSLHCGQKWNFPYYIFTEIKL